MDKKDKNKILVVGLFRDYYYEQIICDTLTELGETIIRLRLSVIYKYFFTSKIEYHLNILGPANIYAYCLLIFKVLFHKPKKIIFRKNVIWNKQILLFIRRLHNDVELIYIENDNPFSEIYQKGNLHQKRHFIHVKPTIPIFDKILAYRPKNVSDFNNHGAKVTVLAPPFYINKWGNNLSFSEKKIDVLFIGHFTVERKIMVEYLYQNGIPVKVVGNNWEQKKPYFLNHGVYGEEYYKLLSSSKICLAFYSKLNQDVYTRRCFEIPFCKSLLVAEKTKEIQDFFIDGYEAIFFKNKQQLLKKLLLITKS